MLTQDWQKTEAFKLGIIDANGNELKSRNQLKTSEEQSAYTKFHKLVYALKKQLSKIPYSQSTFGRYSTALALIKEECSLESNILEETFINYMKENIVCTSGFDMADRGLFKRKKKEMQEDTGDETFASNAVFNCDSDTFKNCRLGKRKYLKYKTYVGDDEIGQRIRSYGLKNPEKAIVLKDDKTGAMIYFRRKK